MVKLVSALLQRIIHEPPTPVSCLDRGRVIIASSQDEVDRVIKRWTDQAPQPVAIDFECAASATVANGSGLHPHLGTIRLAQLAVRDDGHGRPEALVVDCWKFQLNPILELLHNPDWPILIHYAAMECRWLGWCYGVEITHLIDTHALSKALYQEGPHNLSKLAERSLGKELDKSCQASSWDATQLSQEQLTYAADDVLVLLDIWQALSHLITKDIQINLKETAEKHGELIYRVSTDAKGCEVERALKMINAARTLPELSKIEQAFPYMRLHHSNHERIKRSLRRTRRRLERGEVGRRPVKVEVASWRQPF